MKKIILLLLVGVSGLLLTGCKDSKKKVSYDTEEKSVKYDIDEAKEIVVGRRGNSLGRNK